MRKSKIITVVPTNTGAGAKFTTVLLAQSILVHNPKAKVAIVDFDFRNPYLAAYLTPEDTFHGIDNLLEKIDANYLSRELFKENMVRISGTTIDVLKGTKLGGRYDFISKLHVETIINLLREEYDYALISVNTRDDNSGTVFALNKADEVVVVAAQDYMGATRLNGIIDMVETYRSVRSRIKLFINRRDYRYDEIRFEKETDERGLEVIGSLPYDPTYVDNRYLKATLASMLKGKVDKKWAAKIKPFSQSLLMPGEVQ